MKFRRQEKYQNIFKNHAENEVGRLDLNLFFFFFFKKGALDKVKAGGLHLTFNIFW